MIAFMFQNFMVQDCWGVKGALGAAMVVSEPWLGSVGSGSGILVWIRLCGWFTLEGEIVR